MKTFQDGAYAMAALSAAVVAFRILVKKGLLTRDEAVRSLLDEAVQRAIFAESLHEGASPRSTAARPTSTSRSARRRAYGSAVTSSASRASNP